MLFYEVEEFHGFCWKKQRKTGSHRDVALPNNTKTVVDVETYERHRIGKEKVMLNRSKCRKLQYLGHIMQLLTIFINVLSKVKYLAKED